MNFHIEIIKVPSLKIKPGISEYKRDYDKQTFLNQLLGKQIKVAELIWRMSNGDIILLDSNLLNYEWILPPNVSLKNIKEVLSVSNSNLKLKILQKKLTSQIGFIQCEIIDEDEID